MRNKFSIISFGFWLALVLTATASAQSLSEAPAPLFRDPVYDGAADPVVIWNTVEQNWWMLYTQRRANEETADVAFCYGNEIGIASSGDHGKTWIYRGTLDLEFEHGKNTFWAPELVFANGTYHMFVVYIRGVRNHWGGDARMAHYISKNLWNWKFEGLLSLSSDDVIDATLFQDKNGIWKMWYKDNSQSWLAESKDLYNWTWRNKPIIADQAHEGPIVFEFKGYYWLVTDQWAGMGVYRSYDLENWTKQENPILEGPSNRPDDKPSGAHGDVVVVNDQAYIFYFTHPGRELHSKATLDEHGKYPINEKRSSIQVAELYVENGLLKVKDRDKSFHFYLPNSN
ncbi:hypothetical protein [Maribellus sediminis]|uniref:hypothetical protein n=1 Tax=Maribellus sediminis TaxID=2696285 RepID=UPI00197CD618|nr:hypothetical protein [Maribellus sediminis]